MRYAIGECLEKGSYTAPELRAAGFCKRLLKRFNALWTFVEEEFVEPTNNDAERGLRPAVIWRKNYFCTHSDYGRDFVARTASVSMTCRMQAKSMLDFLSDTMKLHFSGLPAPPLI